MSKIKGDERFVIEGDECIVLPWTQPATAAQTIYPHNTQSLFPL